MRPYILADNQYITRKGVVCLLKELSLASQITEVLCRMELMQQLTAFPDAVVLIDYTLFDLSDVQMMNIRQRFPQSLWVLFSEELSGVFLRQTLLSGQKFSVVRKNDAEKDIINALQYASRGDIYLCETALQIISGDVISKTVSDELTASERRVLHEIAMGKTTKEIAFEQNLSFHTINTHRKNIFRKLEINNMHEAVKYAIRAGIIELTEYYI
jgi:DNA-binding NarL/FixJ family response regulator